MTRKYKIDYGVELDILTPIELKTRVYDAISSKVDLSKIQQKKALDLKEASKMKTYLKKFP